MILHRRDIYDKESKKYLVLVREDVESAEERLQELQQEMADLGILASDFELGDVLGELDGGDDEDKPGGPPRPSKKKVPEWPTVEGEESIQEYLGQYRRAVLSRKALLKGAKEKLEGSKGHELLGLQHAQCTVNALPRSP